MKREHLFSLTMATGHVYYLQTAGDVTDWITAVHNGTTSIHYTSIHTCYDVYIYYTIPAYIPTAATSALTGQSGHSESLGNLQERIEQLDKLIDKVRMVVHHMTYMYVCTYVYRNTCTCVNDVI